MSQAAISVISEWELRKDSYLNALQDMRDQTRRATQDISSFHIDIPVFADTQGLGEDVQEAIDEIEGRLSINIPVNASQGTASGIGSAAQSESDEYGGFFPSPGGYDWKGRWSGDIGDEPESATITVGNAIINVANIGSATGVGGESDDGNGDDANSNAAGSSFLSGFFGFRSLMAMHMGMRATDAIQQKLVSQEESQVQAGDDFEKQKVRLQHDLETVKKDNVGPKGWAMGVEHGVLGDLKSAGMNISKDTLEDTDLPGTIAYIQGTIDDINTSERKIANSIKQSEAQLRLHEEANREVWRAPAAGQSPLEREKAQADARFEEEQQKLLTIRAQSYQFGPGSKEADADFQRSMDAITREHTESVNRIQNQRDAERIASEQKVKDASIAADEARLRSAGLTADAVREAYIRSIDAQLAKLEEASKTADAEEKKQISAEANALRYSASQIVGAGINEAQYRESRAADTRTIQHFERESRLRAQEMERLGNRYGGESLDAAGQSYSEQARIQQQIQDAQRRYNAIHDDPQTFKYNAANVSEEQDHIRRLHEMATIEKEIADLQKQQSDSAAELAEKEAEIAKHRSDQISDLKTAGQASEYRAHGNNRMAEFLQMQHEIDRQLRDSANDPELNAAVRAKAQGQIDEFLHAGNTPFMGSTSDYLNRLQSGIWTHAGGADKAAREYESRIAMPAHHAAAAHAAQTPEQKAIHELSQALGGILGQGFATKFEKLVDKLAGAKQLYVADNK